MKKIFTNFLRHNIHHPPTNNITTTRVLLITYDAIGDMIMTVPLINVLQKERPYWQIEVLSSPRNTNIIAYHPAIKNVWKIDINRPFYKIPKQSHKELKKIYKQEFDILIYLGERISSATFWRISKLKASQRFSLPFTQKACKQKGMNPLKIGLFDKYIGLSNEDEPHFYRRMLSILEDFNISYPSIIDFTLHLPHKKLPTTKLLQQKNLVLLNPSGSQNGNTLSKEQTNIIITELQKYSITICLFETTTNRNLIDITANIFWLPSETILLAAQWISMMDLIVTTDTAIGHLGVAQNKDTIIMRSKEKWRDCCNPLSNYAKILYSEDKDIKMLSPSNVSNLVKEYFSIP